MKNPGEVITDLVNASQIEEVPEGAVSDKSGVVADQMLVSIAISLKRIADAVSAMPDLAGIYGAVNDMAYQAGQHFEAGKRRA